MDDFEFLKNSFQRLAEMEAIERNATKEAIQNKKPPFCDHGSAAISCIIRDFIELTKGSGNGQR